MAIPRTGVTALGHAEELRSSKAASGGVARDAAVHPCGVGKRRAGDLPMRFLILVSHHDIVIGARPGLAVKCES